MTPGTDTPPDASSYDAPAATPAGTYEAFTGGKDATAADRAAARRLDALAPGQKNAAAANRDALERAVALAADWDFARQYLDIGAGMPQSPGEGLPNLSEVAGRIQPGRRWLSMDVDAKVLAHRRAMDKGEGIRAMPGDLRDPDKLLDDAAAFLDLSKPAFVVLGAVLHYLDDEEAARVIPTLRSRLVPGSGAIVTHATTHTVLPASAVKGSAEYQALTGHRVFMRSLEGVAALLDGCELLDPGLVTTIEWRPDEHTSLYPDLDAPHYLAAMVVLHRGS